MPEDQPATKDDVPFISWAKDRPHMRRARARESMMSISSRGPGRRVLLHPGNEHGEG